MASDLTVVPVGQSTLAEYTRLGLILPRLRQRDAAGIINELSQVLQSEGFVPDLLPFYHTALNQELMGNSAHSGGIALPHGRLNGVKRLQFAFGRAPEPVAWGTKGSCSVSLVFLVAVPATDAASYLHLMASLARLAQQPERLSELRAAEDPTALLAILDKIKLRQ